MKPLQLLPLLALTLIGPGCLSDSLSTKNKDWLEPRTPDLPGNPHGTESPLVTENTHLVSKPASPETATRVANIGNMILDANKQIGIRPQFMTVGLPRPEIAHKETKLIVISESLVNQCPGDAQLAAVLCSELGKVVAERQTQLNLLRRLQERPEPMTAAVGNSSLAGPADRTEMVMTVKTYGDRRSAATTTVPNPDTLARAYLRQAGFAESDLDSVRETLKTADANSDLQRQLSGK